MYIMHAILPWSRSLDKLLNSMKKKIEFAITVCPLGTYRSIILYVTHNRIFKFK